MNAVQNITVIGAGFGALSTVRELRKRDSNVAITLIAPRAELHYLPVGARTEFPSLTE